MRVGGERVAGRGEEMRSRQGKGKGEGRRRKALGDEEERGQAEVHG